MSLSLRCDRVCERVQEELAEDLRAQYIDCLRKKIQFAVSYIQEQGFDAYAERYVFIMDAKTDAINWHREQYLREGDEREAECMRRGLRSHQCCHALFRALAKEFDTQQ